MFKYNMEIKENTKTNFVRFFGRNTRMKVLDFLIENDRTSWNKGEIMSHANVGHTCLTEVLKELLKFEVIKMKNKKFTMDKKNKFTKLIYEIYNEINKLAIKELK